MSLLETFSEKVRLEVYFTVCGEVDNPQCKNFCCEEKLAGQERMFCKSCPPQKGEGDNKSAGTWEGRKYHNRDIDLAPLLLPRTAIP